MAFRKRNIALGRASHDRPPDSSPTQAFTGVRPSPLTSHPVISTGAASIDSLLGGHGGLALGSSILIEEGGTTDFAGAILRYYAAEGICQGHVLHIVGMGDPWVRELPDVAEDRSAGRREQTKADEEKMKIAWRYERLGQAGESVPLELYPRSSGLVRWAETFSDGVIELTPFPHLMDASNSLAESGGARSNDDQPQGLVKVHKVPIDTERGEGGAGVGNSIGEDLAFTVSRRKFVVKPFSLPPMEGDQEGQKEGGKLTGKDVEF